MKLLIWMLKACYAKLADLLRYAQVKQRYPTLRIHPSIVFVVDDFSALQIGDNVSVGAFSEIVVIKQSAFSIVRGGLSIGNNVVIGKGANIRAAGGQVSIGDNALLAQDVSLIAANHDIVPNKIYRESMWASDKVGIALYENVWVGAGAIILPGVTVGENAVIAAGSVVTRDVPANQIWAGVPAVYMKDIG